MISIFRKLELDIIEQEQISKRVLQENKVHQISWKTNIY